MTFDRMIVLDFETTGLQPGYRPVEIAWLEFDSLYKVSQSVTSLIDPQIPIEPGAQRVHGISSEMLAGMPTLEEFLQGEHADKFADEHVLVVAHNAAFDLPMFAPFCKKATSLCTMRLAQALYPTAENHKLQTLASMFAVDVEPTHRAMADVGACFELLRTIAKKEDKSIDELLVVASYTSPESLMPFGKHKGKMIKDLPSDYVAWLSTTLEPSHWIHPVIAQL
jgi:DNA polymerase III epsilon subunit-like protein